MAIDTFEKIRRMVRCSACQGPIVGRVNLVELQRRATWKYPTAGNFLTGTESIAVGIICDHCVDVRQPIVEAVEYRGEDVVYHPIESLESTY